jgi:glycosyltransferase involved in cell wall biosynthesis
MLLGYPNILAEYSLRFASDGLQQRIEWADVLIVREPWQFRTVYEMMPDEMPIVLSSHNVEIERFSEIQQPFFEEWTIGRVRMLEQFAVDHADAIITTSERDSAIYRGEFGYTGPDIVASNGTYESVIREHRPHSSSARRLHKRYRIDEDATVCLFMGSNYKPNVVAAEKVLKMARELPEVEFVIMGSVGNALSKKRSSENMTITGYVKDDYEAHFDLADIALNPMAIGGGTNIKIIDYMARSLPVISTPFGVRGLPDLNSSGIIRSEMTDFASTIEELSNQDALRQQIGRRSRETITEQYTWEESSRRVWEEMHMLIS